VSDYGDAHDPARLLLAEVFDDLDLEGDPVVIAPNRGMLLITSSDNPAGLQAMGELATQLIDKPRFRSGIALRLKDDVWGTYRPAKEHPAWRTFRNLYVQTMEREYAEQQRDLDSDFVEKYRVMAGSPPSAPDERIYVSVCSWYAGIPSMLPKTDHIIFATADIVEHFANGGDPKSVEPGLVAAWDDVEDVVGDLLEPFGVYPERYKVESFPSDEQLAILWAKLSAEGHRAMPW
jgi:hypothetical protein